MSAGVVENGERERLRAKKHALAKELLIGSSPCLDCVA